METTAHDGTDREPIEEQGLPTALPGDDTPGQSFRGDEPDAGSDGNFGTKSDDADAENADAAREADQASRADERAHATQVGDNQSYGDDPTAVDAPSADIEQPLQNPDSPLGREYGAEPA